jgi:hypothetical protein
MLSLIMNILGPIKLQGLTKHASHPSRGTVGWGELFDVRRYGVGWNMVGCEVGWGGVEREMVRWCVRCEYCFPVGVSTYFGLT